MVHQWVFSFELTPFYSTVGDSLGLSCTKPNDSIDARRRSTADENAQPLLGESIRRDLRS
jgi:hypothetical protein